jgi:hypothetical protein
VLVVVEHWDVHAALRLFLNVEALRRLGTDAKDRRSTQRSACKATYLACVADSASLIHCQNTRRQSVTAMVAWADSSCNCFATLKRRRRPRSITASPRVNTFRPQHMPND